MFNWFRSEREDWPEMKFEEIKKRARLLVIDDNEFPYKDLFGRDGYTLEKWEDVTDLPKLESGYFDVILLDLQGVGKAQSPSEQGLGVLRHLRQTSPAQVIIAFSSADWPLKYQDFFKLADAVLSKTSDYVDFKRKVDELLNQRFSLGFYVRRVQAIVGTSGEDAAKLEKLSREAIVTRKPQKLRDYLQDKVTKENLTLVVSVIQSAVNLAKLWQS
jgi:CheY-like chemotaxis protein